MQAGIHCLRRGGNAVDAALASAITLTVVEPNNNGLGSDAFALIWDGKTLAGLNASGRAPAAWSAERFRQYQRMPTLGWDSVTVPGAVSAWVALSERYGRLPFADLFTDAVSYARNGFQVGPKTAYYWRLAAKTYAGFHDFEQHFLPAPKAGELFFRPDLANSLEQIADSGGGAFYQGALAEQMVSSAKHGGGALTMDDLASHQADWVDPIAQPYRAAHVHEIPPNGQGLAAQIALGILQHRPCPNLDSAQAVHEQIEAMKVAIQAAAQHFADPAAMRLSPAQLLEPNGLARLAAAIKPNAAPLPPAAVPVSQDTVYLTTADASGMMVSFIQSNFLGFGSGIVIPGTGISMQNRGSGFSLDPTHPNCVAPGKRPYHTIIPGFVTQGGQPLMSFGVMGGHMQHQGHVQMVNRVVDHQQNPQAASDAPRWHVYPDFSVGLEVGMPQSVARSLADRGHQVRYEPLEHIFGGAQLIVNTEHGYVGGSDHRKEGLVAGF